MRNSATKSRAVKTVAGSTPPDQLPNSKWLEFGLFSIIVGLFFASGFSSLLYQVVWTRMLVLVFGATTFATSTVLAVFMGGLALGAYVAGRFSPRVRNPLLWYGVLEAIIGVWALLTPFMFDAATPLYKWIWLQTHADLIPFSFLRFICTGMILLVPTTCMGATLPLLAKHVTHSLSNVGSRVGALYSANTLGAVIGAVATGFVILPNLGLNNSIVLGAAVNGALLVSVLLLRRFTSEAGSSVHVEEPVVADESAAKALPFSVKLCMVAFALSGAVAMAYEVSWTRALLMVVGSSTYAFTVMLSAFLIGIFIGSFVCSRFIDRSGNPLLLFGFLQLCVAALTAIGMYQFNYLPYWYLTVASHANLDPSGAMLVRFILAGCVLTPMTICLGAIFPTVVKACAPQLTSVGRSVGSLYAINTLGAIIGAFACGFVLLPLWGAEKTLLYGTCVNALIGVVVLAVALKATRVQSYGIAIGALALILATVQVNSVWNHTLLLNAQSFRRTIANRGFEYKSFEDWRTRVESVCKTLFWADGPCSNVGVIFHTPEKVTSLVTNGHIDASDDADMPVQALVSGFPLLLKPDAKNMAVIGWGCGQTVGTATLFPLKSIEAIELEPAVIEASKHFHHLNHSPEADPRVHIQYNDGRNFLLATDEKFDILVSEPSNPWQAGVCNLFTKEYFAACQRRLHKGGILAVWVQTAEVSPTDLCGVMAALRSQFRHTLTFLARPGNLIILASADQLTIDVPKVLQALTDPALRKEFEFVGVKDSGALLGKICIASDGMDSMINNAYVNSDDRNRLEFSVGKSYEDKVFMQENEQLLKVMSGSPWQQINWGNVSDQQKAAIMSGAADEALQARSQDLAYQWAVRSNASEENRSALRTQALVLVNRHHYADAEPLLTKALAFAPTNAELLLLRASSRIATNRRLDGRHDLEKVLVGEPHDKLARYLLAASFAPDLLGAPLTAGEKAEGKAKVVHDVVATLGRLPDDAVFSKERPNVCLVAAQAKLKLGEFGEAQRYALRLLSFPETSTRGKQLLLYINQCRSGQSSKG